MKTVQLANQARVFALSLGVILSGLVVSGTAGATALQFSFTGIVQGSNLGISPPFAIGQTMFGSFTLHEPLIASNDDNTTSSTIARYNHPITGLSVTIGTGTPYVATFGHPNNHIEIRNNFDPAGSPPPYDSATLVVNKLTSGAQVNGKYTPTSFDITLVDGTAGAFNSQYPTTVPSLSSFLTTNQWRLVFTHGKVVYGSMSSFTAVPLPAAVILFGAGLVALVGLGAGSWRQRKNSLA